MKSFSKTDTRTEKSDFEDPYGYEVIQRRNAIIAETSVIKSGAPNIRYTTNKLTIDNIL